MILSNSVYIESDEFLHGKCFNMLIIRTIKNIFKVELYILYGAKSDMRSSAASR